VLFRSAFFWLKGIESISRSGNVTGFLFISTGLQASATTVIPLFTLIFSVMTISWEVSRGTIRTFFFHPIRRIEFFTAKILVSLSYVMILLISNLAGLLIVGGIKYGLSNHISIGDENISSVNFYINLLIAYLFTLIVLLSVFSYGFFISTITNSLAGSLGFGLGLFYGIEPVRHLIKIGEWDPNQVLFMNFLDKPSSILIDFAAGFDINWLKSDILYGCLFLQIITIFVFLFLSFMIFLNRDIKVGI
jgi:ABC-type transport system involved in multi-copper enzyme maturation permease subunit